MAFLLPGGAGTMALPSVEVLKGMGSTGDAGGVRQTYQKCALAALTTALQMSFLAALYLQPVEEPLT